MVVVVICKLFEDTQPVSEGGAEAVIVIAEVKKAIIIKEVI